MTQKVDFNVRTKSNLKFTLIFYTDETETAREPLTGYSVRIGIADANGAAAPGVNNSTNTYATITDAPNGVISVNVPNSVTQQWSPGTLFYDIRLVGGADADTVLEGKILVKAGIAS